MFDTVINTQETVSEKWLKITNQELEYMAKSQGFETVDELKAFVDMANRKFKTAEKLSSNIVKEKNAKIAFMSNNYGLPF